MIQIHGLFWPTDVGDKWRHSLKHVRSLEWAIAHCPRKRTAVQAGGNVGLWPRRLAQVFSRVITFEPDAISRECLQRNVPANVSVFPCALGAGAGVCDIERASLGSHRVIAGDRVPVLPVDAFELPDLDFLQLDVEGFEWFALDGAARTVLRCRPLIQVELRNFGAQYSKTDADVRVLLESWGYREASQQPGNDVVFEVAA